MRILVIAATLLAMSLTSPARADRVTVAVAANFLAPMQEIAAVFEAATDHEVTLVSGSTGTLYAQAINGAPFDLLLAADTERPEALVQAGFARPENRRTYAIGRLAMWTRDDTLEFRPGVIRSLKPGERIAIANPRLAPYGRAAVQALDRLGGYERIEHQVVIAQNVNQSYQFAVTGNARFAFVSASLVYRDGELQRGSAMLVDDSLYDPVRQDAVLLLGAAPGSGARALFDFLGGPAAHAVLERFGYAVP